MSTFFEKKINREYLNENKVSPLKMLFFDCLSSKLKVRFENSRILRRNYQYRLFAQGFSDFKDEIDVVKLLRNLRYYKAAVKRLMKAQPQEVRDEIFKKRETVISLDKKSASEDQDLDQESSDSQRASDG